METDAVSKLLAKYEIPAFQIFEDELPKSLSNLLYYRPTPTIERIVNTTRYESTGFFSIGKTYKLKDELLAYPNVELVFELSLGCMETHADRCPYLQVNVRICPLDDWLRRSSNAIQYALIKDDMRFRSTSHPNWVDIGNPREDLRSFILIPFNLATALTLRSQLGLIETKT